MLLSFQVRLCFPIPVLSLSHFFLDIPYPACRHITSSFLCPYLFPELYYTVLRWCFFYHNWMIFPYFSIEFFGIRLEDLILPVQLVTFIKSSFPLCFCFYFCFSSSLILGTSMAPVILHFLIISLAFLAFGSLFLSISLSFGIAPLTVSISFSILIFRFGFCFCQFFFFFGLTPSLDSTAFAQAYNIVLTSLISTSIWSKNSGIVKFAKLKYFSRNLFIFTLVRFSRSLILIASVFSIVSIISFLDEVTSLLSFPVGSLLLFLGLLLVLLFSLTFGCYMIVLFPVVS